jgi:AmiR/NasT family two-component response regulator
MTTALSDPKQVMKAFSSECEGYLVKPIEPAPLRRQLMELGLVAQSAAQ